MTVTTYAYNAEAATRLGLNPLLPLTAAFLPLDDSAPDDSMDMPADAPPITHPFADDGDGRCLQCGLAEDDPVHDMSVNEPSDSEAGDILDQVQADPTTADDSLPDPTLVDDSLPDPTADDSLPDPLPDISDILAVPLTDDPDDDDVSVNVSISSDDGKVVDITILADGGVLSEEEPETTAEVTPSVRFRIPLVVPEGISSGDGRTFAENSLDSRPMPISLMWQPEGDDGHKGSVIVGRIDHVERTDQGLGNAYGVFDTGKYGQEALRLVRSGMLRGISADLDEFEADIVGGGEDENKVTSTKLMVNSGRLMGVTLVAKPAFAECTIELDEGESEMDGEYTADTGEARVAALLASAAPLHPPKAWFENPGLSKPTHLTVDDDGRVFGHIAAWDVDHIGLPFGTRAPRSASNYAYFRTGVLRTAEGSDVPVGQLTLAGGHAPLQADARAAVKHYDDTGSAWADVAAGEDQFGIWVSGALRPSVTPEQIRVARASSPSGDWRPIKGSLELVAACCVNVPGFPVARARVASGQVYALTAAGALTLEMQDPHVSDDTMTLALRIEALEAAEKQRLMERQLAIRARVSPVLAARHDALVAAATSARERVNVRRNELSAQREAIIARVAAGGVMPDFKEELHPRDNNGKFRVVLAHIQDALSGHVNENNGDAAHGISKLEDAARLEDSGNHSEADKAATEAGDALKKAANSAADPAKGALETAAQTVRDALSSPSSGGPDSGPVHFGDLPGPLQEILIEAVDHLEQNLNPADPKELLSKAKGFITGTNAMNPNEVLDLVKQNMKDTANPDAPNVLPTAPRAPSAKPTVAIGS